MDDERLNNGIERFHAGEVTDLPEDAWKALEDAGIDPFDQDFVVQFFWGENPEEGDFEVDYLEDRVSEERFFELQDGASPTSEEVSLHNAEYADSELHGERQRGVDVFEVEGTSKSLFYAIVQGDGGDVLNTTIHKSLSEVKEYYEQNGATGSWSWSQSVMSEESSDFAWEMQDTLQILYHDGGGRVGLDDLWSGFLKEVKHIGLEYDRPKIDPNNFRKKSLAITAYLVAMQNHMQR